MARAEKLRFAIFVRYSDGETTLWGAAATPTAGGIFVHALEGSISGIVYIKAAGRIVYPTEEHPAPSSVEHITRALRKALGY